MIVLNIPGVLGIAAASLLLLLIVKVGLYRSSDRWGKALLLVFLCSLMAMALNNLYFGLQLYLVQPHLAFLTLFALTLIGPSLYFYTLWVTAGGQIRFVRTQLLHLLPAIIVIGVLVPFYSLTGEEKIAYINSDAARAFFTPIYVGIYLQILVYVYLSYRCLKVFQNRMTLNSESELLVNMRWLSTIYYGFAAFVLVDGLVPVSSLTIAEMKFIVSSALFLFIIGVVFLAVGQGRVYPLVGNWLSPTTKYSNSGLREDTAQRYTEKLNQLVVDSKPYLDSDLSLSKLAGQLKIHPHYLSQILNERFKQNFYDFVNEYRIDFAKKLLKEEPDLPIVQVAVESGYNNKNSFYNSFKRFVGVTPSEFRRNSGSTFNSNGTES